jgi:hypothetical protein
MIHCVKCLRNVQKHSGSNAGRLDLIEANGYLCGQGDLSRSGTEEGLVTMLGGCPREGLGQIGEEQTLQDFNSWGQEGDGTITGALVKGLPGLGIGMMFALFQMEGMLAWARL